MRKIDYSEGLWLLWADGSIYEVVDCGMRTGSITLRKITGEGIYATPFTVSVDIVVKNSRPMVFQSGDNLRLKGSRYVVVSVYPYGGVPKYTVHTPEGVAHNIPAETVHKNADYA